jgi:hypothetical protein
MKTVFMFKAGGGVQTSTYGAYACSLGILSYVSSPDVRSCLRDGTFSFLHGCEHVLYNSFK